MLGKILASYRKNCSAHSSLSQLILPEALKILPLYVLGLLKHPAMLENRSLPSNVKVVVRGHERCYFLHKLLSATPYETINSLYPRLYAVHNMDEDFGGPTDDG